MLTPYTNWDRYARVYAGQKLCRTVHFGENPSLNLMVMYPFGADSGSVPKGVV